MNTIIKAALAACCVLAIASGPPPMTLEAAAQPTAGLLPTVQSTDARLVVVNPRWGAGIRALQFDVTYLGTAPTADCDYRLFDATGNQTGLTGSFQVSSGEKATESIQISASVTLVRVSLRP